MTREPRPDSPPLEAKVPAASDEHRGRLFWEEFLATLARELRNPLAPIRTAAHILRSPDTAPEMVTRATDVIERQVEHLTRLVDDLLDVSRISRGLIELRPERVSISVLIDRALETTRPLIDARRHSLHLDLGNDELMVDADATRLAQVLANLLQNAAKYTAEGGTITVTARGHDDRIDVAVHDTGRGIPPDQLAVIFELFTQLERRTSLGGLGIGLTVVRRLVEMHDGSVEAESDGLGHGSTFVVRLPRAQPAIEPPAATREAVETEILGQRVLVVDDNRDAADTLGAMLEFDGHEVHVAYDGRAALEAAGRFRPDVALLDIGLPGLSGYDVARAIRADEALTGTVLIAITGWGQADDRRKAREAGFDHHLVKPIDPAILAQLLMPGQRRS